MAIGKRLFVNDLKFDEMLAVKEKLYKSNTIVLGGFGPNMRVGSYCGFFGKQFKLRASIGHH